MSQEKETLTGQTDDNAKSLESLDEFEEKQGGMEEEEAFTLRQ